MAAMKSFYGESHSLLDLSDEFCALFLDPTMADTCAYFERDDMTLEEAQLAKIDLALGKLKLEPGMTLLDIGCGGGTALRRAIEKYDVNAIGITRSRSQFEQSKRKLAGLSTGRLIELRLQSWEDFDEKVDRILTIGAFEAFTPARYPSFFDRSYGILPDGGRMLLHSIVIQEPAKMWDRALSLTTSDLRFMKFVATEVYPGGRRLPTQEGILNCGQAAGFTLEGVQWLREHYARTLNIWAANLRANHDKALRVQSQEVYDRYLKYLTGCENFFLKGISDVGQFTLVK